MGWDMSDEDRAKHGLHRIELNGEYTQGIYIHVFNRERVGEKTALRETVGVIR